MTDPITAAIRRTIAAAEPMWRDTAVDKLTDEIAQAVRDETPRPATTDDAVKEVLGFLDEMNAGGHISYGDYSHLHDLVAALAAAGVGAEVDREALGSHILATLPDAVWQEGSDVITMHAADAALALLAARGDAPAPVMDREALMEEGRREAARRWRGEGDPVASARIGFAAGVEWLAARGAAATPTVTAEALNREWRITYGLKYPESTPPWLLSLFAALGIEVTP